MTDEIKELGKLIANWIQAGARTTEILDRMNDPSSVARGLIDRAVERRQAGEDYLGRKPQ